jgi:hypothetical protein
VSRETQFGYVTREKQFGYVAWEKQFGYVAREKQFTLLGVFAELQKLTISFVTSVCLSAWNVAPSGWIFIKFDISGVSENLSIKFSFH